MILEAAWLNACHRRPVPRPVQSASTGQIVATPQVGGLHHRDDLVAA
jgi:hypothetical protein